MRTKKLTLFAILCAVGLVLGLLESTLPVLLVVPGGKIGLANIVTMMVFCLFSFPETIAFALARSLLTSVLYSGMTAFFYSATGSVLSVVSMYLFRKLLKNRVTETGLSVIGATAFQIGQLAVACVVLNSIQVLRYFPALGVVSAFAGLITGYMAKMMIPYIKRKNLQNHAIKGNGENNQWK